MKDAESALQAAAYRVALAWRNAPGFARAAHAPEMYAAMVALADVLQPYHRAVLTSGDIPSSVVLAVDPSWSTPNTNAEPTTPPVSARPAGGSPP